jgi:hypothetical protein
MAEKKDAKPTWISTQSEISKAIQGWSDVTQDIIIESKVSPKIAPDEQMLSDIEALIQKIKAKLDEFSAPSIITEDTNTKELPISMSAEPTPENP